MELFEKVFDRANIYETLFFNIKHVTAHKDVFEFQKKEPQLFKQWEMIAATKYKITKEKSTPFNSYMMMLNDEYVNKGMYYPEFSKIIAITYATVYAKDGKLNRVFKKIINNDEFIVIKTFYEILDQISKDGVQSTPHYFPTLCGHNIINNDIPLYIKRLVKYRNKFDNKENLIPFILKNHLKAKPWDANIIDTINLWKFNGMSNTPLSMIGEFLELKRTVDLIEMNELSKYYWKNINESPEETLDYFALQSATQTNLIIQLINELSIL